MPESPPGALYAGGHFPIMTMQIRPMAKPGTQQRRSLVSALPSYFTFCTERRRKRPLPRGALRFRWKQTWGLGTLWYGTLIPRTLDCTSYVNLLPASSNSLFYSLGEPSLFGLCYGPPV